MPKLEARISDETINLDGKTLVKRNGQIHRWLQPTIDSDPTNWVVANHGDYIDVLYTGPEKDLSSIGNY